MKAQLLIMTVFTLTATAFAHEKTMVNDGSMNVPATGVTAVHTTTANNIPENEKDLKIVSLNKLIEQQQRLYEEKITYLEFELKKSKERLVEKSINHDKMQAYQEKIFNEESAFLKRELVVKTKTLMEYQRQLEKMKPSDEVKNLIKVNTDLALEIRRSADQLALIQLKGDTLATKPMDAPATGGRMPASTNK